MFAHAAWAQRSCMCKILQGYFLFGFELQQRKFLRNQDYWVVGGGRAGYDSISEVIMTLPRSANGFGVTAS